MSRSKPCILLAFAVTVFWPALGSAMRSREAGARVLYVSSERAYVDRGSADGVQIGDALRVARGSERVGTCTVLELGDHFASCDSGKLRRADSVELIRPPRVAPALRPPPRPLSRTRISQAEQALEKAAQPRVEYAGALAARESRVRAGGSLEHAVWGNFGAPSRTFQRESIDVGLRAAELAGTGLRVDADLTARYFSQRPESARFRPEDDAQLYVWQGGVRWRGADTPLSVAAGRIRPHLVPGLRLLDGAQVGVATRLSEIGLFGGLLPDVVTLAPESGRWTAGLYGASELALGADVLVRPTARISYLEPGGGRTPRVGGEVVMQTRLGRAVEVGGAARSSFESGAPGSAGVDAWALDLEVRPLAALLLLAAVRSESGPAAFDGYYEYGLPEPDSLRFDASARYTLSDSLALVGLGGAVRDGQSEESRGFAGAEAALSRTLPWRGRLALGFIESLGILPSHNAYLTLGVSPGDSLRLWLRLLYDWHPGEHDSWQEGGAALFLEAPVAEHMAVRFSLSLRAGRLTFEEPQLGADGNVALAISD